MKQKNPVKLIPACKDYLWGGTRLKEEFHKNSPLTSLAETWELAVHKDGQSTLEDGRTLGEYLNEIGPEGLGENCKKYDYFPLLIKFIDAKGDLSVQVHPNDAYARKHEGEFGKTEMWYVVDCTEGASLYYGFTRDITAEEYRTAIAEGTLTDLLNKVPVRRGDVFFIPAGTVHAIGAGILICEIQQNSNSSYRVYDYNRRDKNGNLRPLHIEKALEVSDLKKAPPHTSPEEGENVTLAACDLFEVRRLRCRESITFRTAPDSFRALTVTAGEGILHFNKAPFPFRKGDTFFLAAQQGEYTVTGSCELILSKVN